MALGSLLKTGVRLTSPSIKRALSKAITSVRGADARLTDRVVSKITKTPSIVRSREASIRAKVAATDAARNASYGTARRIVNTGYGVAGAGTLGTIGAFATSGSGSTSSRSASSASSGSSKPPTPPKPNTTVYVSKPSAPATPAVPVTPAKPAKKKAKMASVPTVKNRRTPTSGPKTSVPVGSSIIRNKDGSIKKVNKPSGKKPKNKFEKMTTAQKNRLTGKEAAAYRKYLKSKGK